MVKKIIKPFKIIGFTELLVIATYFISFEFFINLQVAFATSLFVILGASYAYKKMVKTQVESKSYEDKRDLLDDIEDPHELYSEEIVNETPAEELDLKKIVKEEKAKIKTLSVKSMKHGAKGSFSAFRVVPYIFLALGFIALENNELLNLAVYLPSLLVGIVVGSLSAKELSS